MNRADDLQLAGLGAPRQTGAASSKANCVDLPGRHVAGTGASMISCWSARRSTTTTRTSCPSAGRYARRVAEGRCCADARRRRIGDLLLAERLPKRLDEGLLDEPGVVRRLELAERAADRAVQGSTADRLTEPDVVVLPTVIEDRRLRPCAPRAERRASSSQVSRSPPVHLPPARPNAGARGSPKVLPVIAASGLPRRSRAQDLAAMFMRIVREKTCCRPPKFVAVL